MNNLFILASTLFLFTNAYGTESEEKTPPSTPPQIHHHHKGSHSLCDNLGETLSHLTDEKAKNVITGFCANLGNDGGSFYVDKAQVTINIQGDDAVYSEKYKYKDNYGTVNKYDDGLIG